MSHIFYLFDSIEKFSHYADLFEFLTNAKEEDTAIIKICSDGGRCDIAFPMIDAIKNSNAYVFADVIYPSSSMAAMLALSCDAMMLRKNSFLMFHVWAGGPIPTKHSDSWKEYEAMTKSLSGMFQDVLTPFFTDKEIRSIVNGEDKYIHWDDPSLTKRIKRHFKYRNF